MPRGAVRAGELFKKGGGESLLGRRSWKKRVFELADGMFEYYEPGKGGKGRGKKLGEVTLDGAVVSRVHGDPKYIARFQVAERGVVRDGRTFELRAHSDEEMRAWCDALQSTIDRLARGEVSDTVAGVAQEQQQQQQVS